MNKNNNSPNKNYNQNTNYNSYNQNGEQNYNEYYQNNTQYNYNYENQNGSVDSSQNYSNYNQNYYDYNQYNNSQDYSNYNQYYNPDNAAENQYYDNYNQNYDYNYQNTNNYYNNYNQGNNQNYNYDNQNYTYNNQGYNQGYEYSNQGYNQGYEYSNQGQNQNYGYNNQNQSQQFSNNNVNTNVENLNNQNTSKILKQEKVNNYSEPKAKSTNEVNTVKYEKNYNDVSQSNNINFVNHERDDSLNLEKKNNRQDLNNSNQLNSQKLYANEVNNTHQRNQQINSFGQGGTQQFNQNVEQINTQNNGNYNDINNQNIPPIPPIINKNKTPKKSSRNKEKGKGKLIATLCFLLALILLAGGGYYYFNKYKKSKVVNENEIYGAVIQKYKDAINNLESADSSINVQALKAALKEKKNDDYIKYLFYDIDGNGRKELLISRSDKPNNPFDIYTFNKKKEVIRLFNPETIDISILDRLGVDGGSNNSGSAVFTDKTVRIRKFDKDSGEYNFLKFTDNGNKLEKSAVITFTGLDVDNSKYKDQMTGKEYDSKKAFNEAVPFPDVIQFDSEDWHSVLNFGNNTDNDNNNKDNNQRKKPDNYEAAYASILKPYKDALSNDKPDTKGVNTVAISNYKVYGEKQVGKNFLNYGFYDVNGDGIDELLLFTEFDKEKPNEYSPMDVYTLDKDNKVVRITPEYVNGERTRLSITKDKIFQVYGSGGAKVHGYTFYKLTNNGLTLEKTDAFDFDGETNSKVYKRSFPSGKNEEIPVNDFRDKMVNSNNHMKFDFGKRKSIFDFKG